MSMKFYLRQRMDQPQMTVHVRPECATRGLNTLAAASGLTVCEIETIEQLLQITAPPKHWNLKLRACRTCARDLVLDLVPALPLHRVAAPLGGQLCCADCGEALVAVADAMGRRFYCHESEARKHGA